MTDKGKYERLGQAYMALRKDNWVEHSGIWESYAASQDPDDRPELLEMAAAIKALEDDD